MDSYKDNAADERHNRRTYASSHSRPVCDPLCERFWKKRTVSYCGVAISRLMWGLSNQLRRSCRGETNSVGGSTTRYAMHVVLAVVVMSGCVTKPDDIVSRWHTIQNGPMCTTVAEDQSRFNSETVEPRAIECQCSQLVTTKRLVVKAGESPEAWSCPAPVHLAMNNSVMIRGGLHGPRRGAPAQGPS